jgi:general secretion pathway protein H
MQARAQGFTLLEILVVIFIIAIMISMTNLRYFQSPEQRLEQTVNRLQDKFSLALDMAIMQSRNYALGVEPDGYAFFGQDQQGQWLRLEHLPVLSAESTTDHAELLLFLDGIKVELPAMDKQGFQPQIYMDSSGEVTPFMLQFSAKESEQTTVKLVFQVDPLGNSQIQHEE